MNSTEKNISLWPPTFEGAIFDFDGTLSLTHEIWTEVDRIFLGRRGFEVTPEYQRMLSKLGFEAGARYTIDTYQLNETVEDICDEWNRMGRALYETQVELRPGAETYLRALKAAGIPCALATVNDRDVLEACQRVNVHELFDARVYGNDVSRPKDSPDIYLEAARRIGVAPEKCLVFEDLLAGIRSAKSAGMLTCAVGTDERLQLAEGVADEADLFIPNWEGVAEKVNG